jgi:N-methylhydantoinase A
VTTALVGVDVGGTFTDVVAIDDGRIVTTKVPTDPAATDTSVLEGARLVGAGDAEVFNLATTAGLNAVITRRMPKVAFLTTVGHRDILDKGRLWRPYEALTDLSWRRAFSDASRPLVPRYLRRGIHERLRSDGAILIALDEEQARAELEVLRDADVQGVAVCLLHSWVNPIHEHRLRELVREVLGDVVCSISSDVCPLAKEYPRASTATIDVVMKLIYGSYTDRLAKGLQAMGFEHEFNYADCSAMLMPSSYAMERPYRLVLGGPAAGAIAAAHFGTFIGENNLLGADIGGTSCDISVVLDGKPWMNDIVELEWDLIVNALSAEIVTLGAGGGSVVTVGKTGELRVGPESAGADPGPACYGRGGVQPTVTDAALLMGILTPARFLGGKMPLEKALALEAFESLPTSLSRRDRIRFAWMIGLHNISEGLLDITIRRGIDPRDFSLLAFGAAGPMMLPMLLDLLPMKSVIVPPHPGQFSAAGLLSADRVFSESRTLYGILTPDLAPKISELLAAMEDDLVSRAAVKDRPVRVVRTFDGRLVGQGWQTPFIPVPEGELGAGSIASMVTGFHDEYQQRNGNRFDTMPVEGVTYRVQVFVPSPKIRFPTLAAALHRDGGVATAGTTTLRHIYDEDTEAPCYERSTLSAGDRLEGPAIVWEEASTTFVPSGRTATIGEHAELVIS